MAKRDQGLFLCFLVFCKIDLAACMMLTDAPWFPAYLR